MREIQVERSNLKRYLYFVLALIFTIGSVFIAMPRSVVIGVLGTLLFGAAAVFMIQKKSTVLLTLTSEGFTDTSSAAPAGFISWEMVSDMELVDLLGQTFITVFLHDTVAYLDALSPIKRGATESNLTLGYGPINIGLVGTTLRPDEVLSRMIEFWESSKKDDSSALTPPAIDNTAQNG